MKFISQEPLTNLARVGEGFIQGCLACTNILGFKKTKTVYSSNKTEKQKAGIIIMFDISISS